MSWGSDLNLHEGYICNTTLGANSVASETIIYNFRVVTLAALPILISYHGVMADMQTCMFVKVAMLPMMCLQLVLTRTHQSRILTAREITMLLGLTQLHQGTQAMTKLR